MTQGHPAAVDGTFMTRFQMIAIICCWLLNIMDGFDLMTMGLAAPQVMREWGVADMAMGLVFSATSVGMAIGALALAPLANRFGRRRITLISAAVITISVLATAFASSAMHLVLLRFCSGIGFGALIVQLNLYVYELASGRWRTTMVAALHIGFPFGAMLAGAIAAVVLEPMGWRWLFIIAAAMTGAVTLLALLALPESMEDLLSRRPVDALARINNVRTRMKQAPLQEMPELIAADRASIGWRPLFSAAYLRPTIAIWLACLCYALPLHYVFNWTPKVLENYGLSSTYASLGSTVIGLSGIVGALLMGWLSRRFGPKKITTIYFVAAAVGAAAFAVASPTPFNLLFALGIMGGAISGSYSGLMLMAMGIYDGATRNTGVSLAIGVGRIGAILGPSFGAMLIAAQFGRLTIYMIMGVIAVLGAVSVWMSARRGARV